MKFLNQLFGQLRSNLSSFTVVIVISILVIGSVYLYHQFTNVPLRFLTSDVTVAAEVPLYYGIQSQIGIFFWAGAAAICFLSATLIEEKPMKQFFVVSGMVSFFLGIDDIFLFHEFVFPSLGIHQKIVFLSYAILMGVYVLKFYKTILKSNFILLLIAIGCFGLSLLIDNFLYDLSPFYTQLLEDGAKFMGIVFWTTYFYKTAKNSLKNQLKSAGTISI